MSRCSGIPILTDGAPTGFLAGMSRSDAVRFFSENVGREWEILYMEEFLPRIQTLNLLLADPLTEAQARALSDLLYRDGSLPEMIEWLCVGRGETIEDYRVIAEEDRQKRDAEANPNRIRLLNEHDCFWFPDGMRGGVQTPSEVIKFYSERWRPLEPPAYDIGMPASSSEESPV